MAIEIALPSCPHRPEGALPRPAARPSRAIGRQSARKFLETSARSRLLELGPQALSTVDLLSLLLGASRHISAHDLSTKLLTVYGSLRSLMLAERQSARVHGLTPGGYVALQAALEITRRHYQELMMTGPALTNPLATREYLRMKMRDLPHEIFAVVYLNNRGRVIHFQELFRGTIDGSTVHPREVVKEALSRNAAGAIVAHNHPSGVAEPSQADEFITRRLREALALVDIRLIDHLIVGDGCVTSFAERGLL